MSKNKKNAEEESVSQGNIEENDLLTAGMRTPVLWALFIFVPIFIAIIAALLGPSEPVSNQADLQQEKRQVSETYNNSEFSSRPADGGARSSGLRSARGTPVCVDGLWEGQYFTSGKVRKLRVLGRPYRLLFPDSLRTEDRNPARLNFEVTKDGLIEKTWCG